MFRNLLAVTYKKLEIHCIILFPEFRFVLKKKNIQDFKKKIAQLHWSLKINYAISLVIERLRE